MNSQLRGTGGVGLESVLEARQRIADGLVRTPLVHCPEISQVAGRPVFLKLETLQKTGSFKARGALSKILSLGPLDGRGLICASTGNHGLGVAYAAARAGAPCLVVMPDPPNAHKAALLEKLGARVVTYGLTSDERQKRVEEMVWTDGYVDIHPFADPILIVG
ncbi:MAG: pyridoxal-phosphate dependent enzyme, partial [Acidobacteria bacterium]|nr:pyridoxal-phosphate dependent enzyme [Acidobacteriota bacterium]